MNDKYDCILTAAMHVQPDIIWVQHALDGRELARLLCSALTAIDCQELFIWQHNWERTIATVIDYSQRA